MVEEYQQAVSGANFGGIRDVGLKSPAQVLVFSRFMD